MENNDNMDFEDKMIDYVRQWRQLSVSIPLVDDNWLKKTIRKKGIVFENLMEQPGKSINEHEKFINRFKKFNDKHIRLKDNWVLEVVREQIKQKDAFTGNSAESENREMEKDNLALLGNSCLEVKNNFFKNIDITKENIENKTYKSLWDLAVNLAYDEWKEYKTLKKYKSLEEWKAQIKNEESSEYSVCHKINMSLNESGVILKNLLHEMGIQFTGEFWKKVDKNDIKKMSKTLQDIYYLLGLIVKYKNNHRKMWSEYDKEDSFGRSFLKDGKGGLALFIKKNIQDKCGWIKSINIDYSIVGLLSSLFVIPKMLEGELYWNSIDLKKGSDVKFEFVVKNILLNNLPMKSILQRRFRPIESFEQTDYSLLEDVYWFISIRQLKDFFVIDAKERQSIWSEFAIDDIALLKIIENMDSSNEDIDDDSCIKSICVEYILNRHYYKQKESLNKKINRAQENYDLLYDFYQKGMNVFRNSETYEWIFDKTKFLNMTKNGKDKISKIKNAYFKSVILITYIVMGKKEVCLVALNAKTLEKKYSLAQFVNLYKKEKNEKEFFKSPTAQFVWEFLNDRIEWGRDVNKINEFRQTIIMPYLLTHTGLRNNASDENSFHFNEIIAKLLPEHNIDFLDIQIGVVQKRYEVVTGDFLDKILKTI